MAGTDWRVTGSLAYRWTGRYHRGARKDLRAVKRAEAEACNAATRPERRRSTR